MPKVDSANRPERDALSEQGPRHRSRGSMFDDPVTRVMGFAAFGLVIFYLAVIVSALFSGVLGARAPQTAAERDLTMFRALVESGSQSERDWAAYAQALTDGGQYTRAQTIIDQAKEAKYLDPSGHHLALAQTRLFFAQKQWEDAVDAADAGMKALSKQADKEFEKMVASGKSTPTTAKGPGENYYKMLLVKATALEELDRDEEALKDLGEYLDARPTAADILEWRGDVNARLGNNEDAIADYTAARRFMTDPAELNSKIDRLQAGE